MKSLYCALFAILTSTAQAEPLQVMTDILPLQGLVAAVMGDTGKPESIIPPNASPHDFALKPSIARQISDADVVFWVGPDLTPWLAGTLTDLAGKARSVAFDTAKVDQDHSVAHDHAAQGDPHIWLDPELVQHWVRDIADVLAQADPHNRDAYDANAQSTVQAIDGRIAKIAPIIAALKGRPYMVYHDAYGAFEQHFNLSHVAAITNGHAVKPGAAKLRALQKIIAATGPVCLFIDTPTPSPLARQIAAGGTMKIAYLDPLGTQFAGDATHYIALLDHLATTLSECLKP